MKKEDLLNIINLLSVGHFSFNAQQTEQIIYPLIGKLREEIEKLETSPKK